VEAAAAQPWIPIPGGIYGFFMAFYHHMWSSKKELGKKKNYKLEISNLAELLLRAIKTI
jgi:hypothetical protein